MATFLYRLGRASFRRRWLVTGVWAALLIVLGLGAAGLSGQLTNAVSIPGTEAQRAIDHLRTTFPEAGVGGGTARVAIAAPEGQSLTTANNQAAVERVVAAIEDAPEVARVSDPFQTGAVSPDGTVALVQVGYDQQAFELTDTDRDGLERAARSGADAGLTVELGGDATRAAPETGATEILGVLVAALVLVITFGSLLAAGLPLLTALVGVGVGLAAITTASGFLELNANTPVLALMIGLAVGIDYALFIVSRYRDELVLARIW